jgi:hypothetical protein
MRRGITEWRFRRNQDFDSNEFLDDSFEKNYDLHVYLVPKVQEQNGIKFAYDLV